MNELGKAPADKNYKSSGINSNLPIYEHGFNQGYEQAKKDSALTIEDIELLHTFLYAVKNNKRGMFTFTRLSDKQYQEVLRRYKEMRYEK